MRSLRIALCFVFTFVVVGVVAFAGVDEEIAITPVSDPVTKATPTSIEMYKLDDNTLTSARVCYVYVRQSGAIATTECRAVTGAQLRDLLGAVSPSTSTADATNGRRRFNVRLRDWTAANGGAPVPAVTTVTTTSTTGT